MGVTPAAPAEEVATEEAGAGIVATCMGSTPCRSACDVGARPGYNIYFSVWLFLLLNNSVLCRLSPNSLTTGAACVHLTKTAQPLSPPPGTRHTLQPRHHQTDTAALPIRCGRALCCQPPRRWLNQRRPPNSSSRQQHRLGAVVAAAVPACRKTRCCQNTTSSRDSYTAAAA